jgi:thiopeptide-type bacteriocin biosynthesis protein
MSLLSTCDFYLLRVPLLSYEEVLQLHHNTHDDQASFLQAIHKAYSDPLLQEAVFLASPALYEEMMKWLARPGSPLKLPLALYRYLLRMSARCTPYGLFAGCAIGRIHPGNTTLFPAGENGRQKVARLDMEYLSGLVDELVKQPEIRQQVLFYPNNSMYPAGNARRYFEYQLRDKRRHYFLSAFSLNKYLDALLAAASRGARIPDLANVLGSMGVPPGEAGDFIETLIDNQIMVPGLTPGITGPDSLTALVAQLQQYNPVPGCVAPLQHIRQLLQQQPDGVQRYLVIKKLLADHFPGVVAKDPVQVDLFFRSAAADLSQKVTDTLLQRLERLAVLGTPGANADLQTFKDQFLQRYDQREVPLMTALDSESGIGYGIVSGDHASYTPLIDDLVMPAGKANGTINWNVHTKFVWQRFLSAQRSDAAVITLNDADLDELASGADMPPLPASLFLMGSLLAADAAALDSGDFRFLLKSCSGPNALALLGRFAAGNDALAAALKDFARQEQALEKDRIIAEVVHLPEGRTGNVLLRPQLYEYEIPFLGKGGAEEAFQLPVSDLLVSVRNNKVVLRSARLGREIIPRLTSAHNYTRGLAAYKFLCDLQQQAAVSIRWNWGVLLDQPFLPRVVYREIILERARWYLSEKEFKDLLPGHTADAALLLLKEKHRIPGQVLLSEGDNDLLIDFTSEFARMLLEDKLKKGSVVLYEQLFDKDTRLLANEQGAFCNEVIIPVRNTAYQPVAPVVEMPAAAGLQRNFPPGSEWLYAKIYCGPKWMNRLLLQELLPLVRRFRQEQWIDKWFFLRFQDPGHHIRIRFHLPQCAENTGAVMQALKEALAPYLENGTVQQMQFDTYVRELERYGAETMALSETFFFHDSEAVMGLLAAISGAETADRWLLALKGADDLLGDFGYTLPMKLQLLQQLQQAFFTEHHGDAALLLQLNNKYRQHTPLIAAVLSGNANGHTLPPGAAGILQARSAANRELFGQLPQTAVSGVGSLLPHYLHMFLNRMFTANARLHELVIYHYLMKYYTSRMARA